MKAKEYHFEEDKSGLKINKAHAVALAAVLIIAALFFLLPQKGPTGFVTALAVEKTSDPLFNYETIKYPTEGVVLALVEGEKVAIGAVVDQDNLKFGRIPGNGSSVRRFVNLTNLQENEAKIFMAARGDIAQHITFSKNSFILGAGEITSVGVVFSTQSAAPGNYSGEIDVIIQRPKYGFLRSFM